MDADIHECRGARFALVSIAGKGEGLRDRVDRYGRALAGALQYDCQMLRERRFAAAAFLRSQNFRAH